MTVQTILDYLPNDMANAMSLANRLLPADEYMLSSYSVWAMVAEYVAGADGARGERFLMSPGLYEVRHRGQPVWMVLPGLLPIDGAMDWDRCIVSLLPGGVEAVSKTLPEEIGCPDHSVVSMGKGLINRPWLPHFIDRASTDEIADLLQNKKEVPRSCPKPLDEQVYCAASWPDSILVTEVAEPRAEVHRTVCGGDNASRETLRKLRDVGWTIRVPKSPKRRTGAMPGDRVAARHRD